MNVALNSQQVVAAEKYLISVPASFRRRGREYHTAGAVKQVACVKPGRSYQARVQGSFLYDVDLNFDGQEWNANCTCPLQFDCKHAVAATLALLQATGATPASEPQNRVALETVLREQLQRPLSIPEQATVSALREVYRRVGQRGAVFLSELRPVFSALKGASWEQVVIGAATARSELDWWGHLAVALRDRGVKIPAFLMQVVNEDQIRASVAAWQRRQQVERWQLHLARLRTQPATPPVAPRTIAVRLRLGPDRLELDTREPQAAEFRKPKPNALRQMAQEFEAGHLVVAAESLAVWLPFFQRWQQLGHLKLDIHDAEVQRIVGALLRQPATRAGIVAANGAPLVFATEPLRWQVEENANALGDYRLRLVKADGTPAPAAWWVLAGQPALYLTDQGIFAGPPQFSVPQPDAWGQLATVTDQALVPAPVLESAAGLELLHQLGAPLPACLSERVRHVPLRLRLSASLANNYGQEQVYVTMRAVGASRVEDYTDQGWNVIQAGNEGEQFALFDRQGLVPARTIIQAGDLKWDNYSQEWRWRVTRNFPDRFATWLATIPAEVEVQLDSTLATLRDAPLQGKVRLDVQSSGVDWFDLKVVLDVADTDLTKEELKALLDARGGFVRLGQAGWRRLQFDLGPEENAQLAQLGLDASDFSSEPQRLHALQLADTAASRFLPAAQVAEIRRRASELTTRVNPALPALVKAELRPYQLEGYHFLAYLSANRFGGILADDMGLGKTLQALTWLAWLRAEQGKTAKPALVVCPKSVMDNWQVEAERFTPGLRVSLWTGQEGATLAKVLKATDLLVINYAQLRLVAEQLTAVDWLVAILDEGQYIKNPESQTARAAGALRADYRLVLTGTPIENRLMDLWSLMSFAMPGVLGPRVRFARQFDKATDPLARQRLAARVRPFLLRRTKAQVAPELPDRIEEDLLCEMEPAQRDCYRAELKKAQQQLLLLKTARDFDRERFSVLTSLLRLRQICCHPALIDATAKDMPSAKIEALVDLLEPLMEEGHKVLVFSQFVGLIQLLQPLLAERQWKHFVLTGATEERGQLVSTFQKTRGAAVFLISLRAGGFGLNLTAASYVVLFDPWWNPAVENQAIDRTHRIGQTRHVNAYRLLIKDTVEEKIRHLQKSKSALAADVFGEERFAQALTLEDLKFLLADLANP